MLGDDEAHCDVTCPFNCTCTPGETDCRMKEFDIRSLTDVSTFVRKLDLSYNQIMFDASTAFFKDFIYLAELTLGHCNIWRIPDLLFSNLKNLYALDLSYNKLRVISKKAFVGLGNLNTLKLEGNTLLSEIEVNTFHPFKYISSLNLNGLSLKEIAAHTFQGMTGLRVLNLSNNPIDTIENNAFRDLTHLRILDIRSNSISSFGKNSFAGLNSLMTMYTDSFLFCCIRPSTLDVRNCFPQSDEFSSCADLMRNEVLRTFLWIVGIFAFFGNILSFIFRLMSERDTLKCGYGILMTNLSLADMLMGVYLLIISCADTIYRGTYSWNAVAWRSSTICTFAGVLALVSVECSVLILTLITFDRLKSIKYLSGFSSLFAIISCTAVWLTAILAAVVPILPSEQLRVYFGESFYSVSGVCLTLPLTTKRMSGWGYSAGVLIVFNFLCFICIAIGQGIVYFTVSRTKIMLETPDRRTEFQVAKRLSTIIITDFLAWCPICALGKLHTSTAVLQCSHHGIDVVSRYQSYLHNLYRGC